MKLLLLLLLVFVASAHSLNVTYDSRALILDGQRRLLLSGCIHYPRSTPDMWPSMLDLAKQNGLDVIQTYVFWDAHQPTRFSYNFNDQLDLIRFLKECQQAGLFVNLRIGPYVCAEWNLGGFPEWLREIPGMVFRTYNEPFMTEMAKWVQYVVNLVSSNNMFASQGGPVILAQIENEYGNIESDYGADGHKYMLWCADFANSLKIGVPWIMCQQDDAPSSVIATCNSFYCDGYTPNPGQPKMWTENWPGWFQLWGDPSPHRPAQDVAFAVARFFARGGAFMSYYMYQGGTNFGRTSGGPNIVTSYDYDVSLDEYGLPAEPKYSHLGSLHALLHRFEALIMSLNEPNPISLGKNLEAHVYNSSTLGCLAFLSNIDASVDADVVFNGRTFHLPAWSVSLLSTDCQQQLYNTAIVTAPVVEMSMHPVVVHASALHEDAAAAAPIAAFGAFSSYSETIGQRNSSSAVFAKTPLEQVNTTHDLTDYLWYTVNFTQATAGLSTVTIKSVYDVAHVFVNRVYIGSTWTGDFANSTSVLAGLNVIDILSATVGLQNYGSHLEAIARGLVQGSVKVGSTDLTGQGWWHTPGTVGEELSIFTPAGAAKVAWNTNPLYNRPLTWYKTSFTLPAALPNPVALDMTGMGKGAIYVNGHHLGRYWPSRIAQGTCDNCDYRGAFDDGRCRQGCGLPSQRYYHVPRGWLQPGENLLVLFEELGGTPTLISLVEREEDISCGSVGEDYPADNLSVVLSCGSKAISGVEFASFGTPLGTCREFQVVGGCHSANSTSIVQGLCIGKRACTVPVSLGLFGDPCPNVAKRLSVQVKCG